MGKFRVIKVNRGLKTDKRNEALDNYRHSTKAKSIDYLMSLVRCDVKQYFSGGVKTQPTARSPCNKFTPPSAGKFAVALDNFSLSPPRERKILSHSGH